ncbi:hypothetical protein [Secundilactobacillus mixtipabuli]|uniref:Uncharacterized protein n=1 Tax=Secundilactobacillus mixtipabuli TaxID=1435342 RepID=A0A1Z5IDD8_9LACO|nr:hypothetical protein [Secundilactobacillus mixtipabuli]GAW99695.1 hypothetical protein IWT30_01665 [Secundilactobacillus mixtipabuli]
MKLKNYVLLGAAGLALGVSVPLKQSTAKASTYHSVPSSLRGYYISSSNRAFWITKYTVHDVIPQADGYGMHVTKVTRSGHTYRVHTYIDMGGRSYVTYKLNRYAHNKFKYAGKYFHKVSKSHYYYYVSH